MAALVEGCRYGLSSHESTSADKTTLHVKLTEHSLKAIEEFQKIKYATNRKPTIRFHGDNGVISIPKTKSSDDPEGVRSFQFTLSTIQGDPNGSFECIQQLDKSHRQELQMMGPMSHIVRVRATDDVYQATSKKWKQAEEESKKNCTKEIKPSGPNIGQRKKVKHPKPVPPPTRHSPSLSSSSYQATKPLTTSSAAPKPLTTSSVAPKPLTTSPAAPRPLTTSSVAPKPLTTSSAAPKPLTTSPALPFSSKAHSSLNVHKSTVNKSAPNPTAFAQPFRDRIVHLLAIRSYKKPELHLRLNKDGIKDKDKNTFSTVLNQVAQFSPKDNSYSLAKHAYADVREDWPLYTETDLKLLRRKMALISEQPPSASTSPALSPCHSNSSQGSPSNSQKRPTSIDDTDSGMPQSKKQRIAHTRKDNNDASGSPKSNGFVAGSAKRESQFTVSDSSLPEKDRYCTKAGSPASPSECQENNNFINRIKHEKVKEGKAEYISSYAPIKSLEQRQKYKSDFNAEYNEYRRLHTNIDKKTKIFSELHEDLKQQEKGSDIYENIKNRIFSEYKNVKRDPKFIEQRKRCDFLHKKLGHIKNIIAAFDNARLQSQKS